MGMRWYQWKLLNIRFNNNSLDNLKMKNLIKTKLKKESKWENYAICGYY